MINRLLACLTAILVSFCISEGHPCQGWWFQQIHKGAGCEEWAEGLANWMLQQPQSDEEIEYWDWYLSGSPDEE